MLIESRSPNGRNNEQVLVGIARLDLRSPSALNAAAGVGVQGGP